MEKDRKHALYYKNSHQYNKHLEKEYSSGHKKRTNILALEMLLLHLQKIKCSNSCREIVWVGFVGGKSITFDSNSVTVCKVFLALLLFGSDKWTKASGRESKVKKYLVWAVIPDFTAGYPAVLSRITMIWCGTSVVDTRSAGVVGQ